MSIRVVIVEDERLVARDIAQILQDEGYIICAIASDGETAIKKILEFSPDLVLLDIRIKGEIDGIDVAKFIQSFCDIPLVYLSAFSDTETLKRAQLTNPMGYVVKPFRSEQLLSTITIALTTHSARQKEDQESVLKEKFLSIIREELRNPLNAILGFSDCLKQEMLGTVNSEQIEALQAINSSGNHLLKTINRILDLSMLEAGKLTLQSDLAPITPICHSAIEQIQAEACQKSIQIEVNIAEDLPYLMIDERRMFQVLVNLLQNAVKFTPNDGLINLIVKHNLDYILPEQTTTIQISVIDTGIGIEPQEIDKLFQPFNQFDKSYNRQNNGIGLGLAFTKRIVELHGGKVEVHSKLEEGSCFTVSLPCKVRHIPNF
ncbi:ATP-binding protein [Pseudanabaena sp. ABRG5-3]|uniref:hybrid sensor histidine kinase/response regulator n=1 Tax=Pseudanabaena sp. ABRG5-3 TaxID=685565 RepID=UPI000DC6FFAD|nr:ATP-binding protein [Pseudanabaena sp. ABRG5-3]BBC22315.1 multi-sensor signal transduction histidine kinase [Pseudanabaena sp. ABRG5-3]